MDGGVAKHIIGVPNNAVEVNRWDPLFLNIQVRGGYTSGNKFV